MSELRVSRALRDRGAQLPKDGTHVYLTDTLESPHTEPPKLALFLRPIAEQHAKALKVKSNVPVIVCLGNPPYDRHEAATADNKARTGGWVRWGDREKWSGCHLPRFPRPRRRRRPRRPTSTTSTTFMSISGAGRCGRSSSTKPLSGPGVVSFISASSYLDGDAFCGMREHMRRLCDEIWILDLGGEGRGTRKNENVFAIQTPVAIAVAVRSGKAEEGQARKGSLRPH